MTTISSVFIIYHLFIIDIVHMVHTV